MALRILLGLLMLGLAGCGGDPATPRVVDVAPSVVRANVATGITIRLDGVLPSFVDYGSGTVTSESEVTVFANEMQIARTRVSASGTLSAMLPANLKPATYDVIVELSDGRRAVGAGLVTVSP